MFELQMFTAIIYRYSHALSIQLGQKEKKNAAAIH